MKLVIDGSNVVRVLGKSKPRVEVLAALLDYLNSNGITFVVFFDSWLIGKLRSDEALQHQALEQLFARYSESIERGTGGQEADEPLLTFAHHNEDFSILSRDRYRQHWAKYPWLEGSPRLLTFNYVETASQLLIPKLDLVLIVEPLASTKLALASIPSHDHSANPIRKELTMSNPNSPYPGKAAAPRGKGEVDIVFCLDRTGSMQPCIDAVKRSIEKFVNEDLQSVGDINFRLRLIAYGDLISKSGVDPQDKTWLVTDFTNDLKRFNSDLAPVRASGGGSDTAMESTLDAIFIATKSPWRSAVHRAIIVFTDEDTYPDLAPSTGRHPGQNGVSYVIQQLQELRHLSLFLVAPNTPSYKRIDQAVRTADRQVQWLKLKTAATGRIDTASVDWSGFLSAIGQTVSSTASKAVPQF